MSSANPFRQEIVFIVDNLSDWQMLADAARQRGHEVVIVDSNSDGLRQIAGYLSGKPAGSVDAIHLLSHGSAGQIDLGSLTLALDTLPRHAGSLEEIGQAMSEKGDFLLYGCNAAASPEGVALMEGIATLTRADVAASTTMTGHTRFGGDWHLETHSGFIETPNLKIADYASTLALVSFTGDSGNSNSPDATLSNGPASLITITNTATSDALDIAINGTQLFHDTVTNIQSLGIATPTGSSGMILIMPTGEFASSITLSVQGGKSFDFVSMLLMESFDVNETFTFTPNGNAAKKVDVSFSNGQTQTVNLSSNADFDNLSTLTISSSDGNFQAYFDNIQLENIGGGNTPPSIGGAVASQAVNDIATISPFSTLTIEDADNNNVSVTVTLDTAAKGVFTPASLTASGFADATGGSYTLASTTTSAAQAAIRQLVFDPANNRAAVGSTETTTFTIAVNDGTDSTPNTSTTVVSTSINDAPTDIALGNTSVNQSAATNAPVGTLSSTDPDPGSSFTYTLVAGSGDTNNSLFNISGTSLRANDATTMAPGNYSIRVRSTDGGGLFYEEVFAITVNDNVAPVFDESTPSTANIAATALDLNASLNEAGTIYYVVLADGASAPSAVQVKAAQDASGAAALKAGNAAVSSGAFTHTFNLNGLTAETAYDIYVVGQDDEGTPNLMATPTKRDVTTAQAGPSVTDAHISITSTPTGSASTYKVGDTVTAQWDNSASGQNQTGVTGVTMDFSAFGGGTAVTATNNGSGIWSASYVLAAGSIDAGNRNVSVSATDGNGTTSTADSSNLTVDNQAPGVGDARISISGASGTGGAYKIGDTVSVSWNNTAAGDNNADIASVTADFSAFGGGSAVAASNSSGTWTASYTLVAGSIDGTNKNVSLTATDDAGNVTSTADTTNATVDNQLPGISDGHLSISGATGVGGVYKIGDTVTATWNNTASGDNNADTISGVSFDFSQFGGATVAATNSSGTWTATYTIVAGSFNPQSNRNVSASVTDNAGNTATVADSTNATIDNVAPAAPSSLDLATASDSGSNTSDNLTNATTPTISGNGAVANGTVTIISSLGGTLGSSTADGSGNWSFTPGTALAAGSHSITATTTDAAGNVSAASSALSVTIDTSPPTISSVSIPNTAMKIGDVVTATITVSSDSDTYTLSSGSIGGFALGALSKINSTTYTATFTVANGGIEVAAGSDIPVSLVFTDTAGNSNTAYSTAISQNADTINTHAPTDIALSNSTISTAAANGAAVGNLNSSDATPGDSFTYALVAGTGDSDNGSFSIVGNELRATTPSALSVGNKTIRVQSTDVAGNVYVEQMTVTAVSNPTVSLSLDDNSLLAGQSATLTLTFSEPPVGFAIGDISVSGGTLGNLAVDALDNKIYTATFTPNSNTQSLSGSLSIAAGTFTNGSAQPNLPSNTLSLTGDTLRPTVSSIERQTPSSATTRVDTLVYRVSFDDSVTNVDAADFTLSGTSATIGSVTALGGNAYSVTVSGGDLAGLNGTVTLGFAGTQNITDSAGNALGSTTPTGTHAATYTVDNTAPTLNAAGSSPADNATNIAVNSPLTVKFAEALDASSDLSKVYLKDVATDTLVPATITLNGSGELLITPTGNLAYSTAYYLTWDADALKDAAGNAATAVSDETTFNVTTAAPPPPPEPTPTPTTAPTETPAGTYDGVTITSNTQTNSNGTSITTITVPVVQPTRIDQQGTTNPTHADIPVAQSSTGERLIEVSVPTGIGLTAQTLTGTQKTLRDILIEATQPRVGQQDTFAELLQAGIDSYVPGVQDQQQVTVRTVTLSAGTNTQANALPIIISGAEGTGESSAQHPLRQEALVIDARQLPPGSILQLNNVEFAIIIGATKVTGGNGNNFAVGDDSAQFMVLGADDDVLRGGAGDDIVASRGGDDQLFGDAGNDWLVGGIGNDILQGGDGNDLLHGGASDAGTYRFTLNAGGKVHGQYDATHPEMAWIGSGAIDGNWWWADGKAALTDPRLGFVYRDGEVLQDIAVLYQALAKRLPSVAELNLWSGSGFDARQLGQLAYEYYLAQQGVQAQALEVQLTQLIQTVWGGTADAALVNLGVSFLSAGGTWGDALRYLARHENNSSQIKDAAGRLKLAQDWTLKETGWSGDGGNDQLLAGAGNDVLVAGSGNNVLDGGAGSDLAVFFGSIDDWQVSLNASQEIVLQQRHTGVQHVLREIELAQFGDTVYGQAKPGAPALNQGQWVNVADCVDPVISAQLALVGVAGWTVG